MAKWEYCKIVQPVTVGDKSLRPTSLKFLGPSKEESRTEEIDELDPELARLGADGWELVSHTQIWGVMKTTPFPLVVIHYLKREVGGETPSDTAQKGNQVK